MWKISPGTISTIFSFPRQGVGPYRPEVAVIWAHDTPTICRPSLISGAPIVVPCPDHNILRSDFL
jgi:hypothetical protein